MAAGQDEQCVVDSIYRHCGPDAGRHLTDQRRLNDAVNMTQSVWDFINTDKAFEIVTGILLSVAIAFTVGTIVMWVSRPAFTFKYQSRFKWFGCFWCGIAMTAVAYFAVFKGLKESTLMEPSFIQYIDQNLGMALLVAFGGFSVLMFLLQHPVASLLIAWATGKQLPLSTTYVTFMVAMGSSLADKAWGRESAVYRVTGVLTVISGWFMTGLAAFTLAAVMATVLHYGQVYAIFGLLALVVVILVKSTIMHRKRENKLSVERFDQITEENILDVCSHQVVDSTLKLREIYNDTVENFFQGDRKALKELADAAERLALTSSEHHKYDILPILYKMQSVPWTWATTSCRPWSI